MVSLYDKDGIEYRIDTYEDFIQMMYDIFPNQFHNVDDVIEAYTTVFDSKIYDHYENALGNLEDIDDCTRYIHDIINDEQRNSGRITKEHYKDILEQILVYAEDIIDHSYHAQSSVYAVGKIL